MKRTGFARPAPKPAKQMDGYTVKPRAVVVAVTDTRARLVVSIPKTKPVRDEAYRRLVAALPCAHCKRPGPSQCAHADEGKGMSIKASDLDTYPLCADAPGRKGCHSLIGASGLFTKEQRRALEVRYVAQTQAALSQSCDAVGLSET